MRIVPGHRTTIWGYDGVLPGPTFTGRTGRTGRGAVVHVLNSPPAPTSTHLHGGVTPPDSDGHPTDLVVPTERCGERLRTGHAPALLVGRRPAPRTRTPLQIGKLRF